MTRHILAAAMLVAGTQSMAAAEDLQRKPVLTYALAALAKTRMKAAPAAVLMPSPQA